MISTRPSFEKTRTQIGSLSNRELLENLEKLDLKERKLKVLVLLYLSEIDTRQLYLPMGYGSLFDFCTMHLKYTRATAGRRIRAARAAAKYPEALIMLRSGEINITTLSMISDILNQDNHVEILDSIKNRSTRHVEMLVSRYRPVPIIRDTVRPVCVKRRVECGAGSSAGIGGLNPSSTVDTRSRKSNKISSSAETNSDNSDGRMDGGRHGPGSGSSRGSISITKDRVILEQRLKLGFSVSPEFMKKYNKIKSLLSNTHPGGIDFETLFEHLMNEYLERRDPENKQAWRKRRAAAREKSASRDSARREHEKTSPRKEARCAKRSKTSRGNRRGTGQKSDAVRKNRRGRGRAPDQKSRRIPPAVRDHVYARDKGRCTFIGANGKRCNSTWNLEIDHVIPYACGGNNSPGNLRLLCRNHNMHEAEKIYGGESIKNRVDYT